MACSCSVSYNLLIIILIFSYRFIIIVYFSGVPLLLLWVGRHGPHKILGFG